MQITQWAVEVTSRKTGERELATSWSAIDAIPMQYQADLERMGRTDAKVVSRDIHVADPAPVTHVTNVHPSHSSSSSSYTTPAPAFGFGFGAGLLFGEML